MSSHNLDELGQIASDNRASREAEIVRCRSLLSERTELLWRQIEPRLSSVEAISGGQPEHGTRPRTVRQS